MCLLTTWRLHLYPTVSCPAQHSSEIYSRSVTCSKVKVAERNDLILFCKHLRELKANLSASLGHRFQSIPPLWKEQVRWKEHCEASRVPLAARSKVMYSEVALLPSVLRGHSNAFRQGSSRWYWLVDLIRWRSPWCVKYPPASDVWVCMAAPRGQQ